MSSRTADADGFDRSGASASWRSADVTPLVCRLVTERAGGQGRAAAAAAAGEPRAPAYPALLLHGQPGSARDWEPVIDAIAGRVQTIAVDRPGWDGRTPPGGLAVSAAAALDALDSRGIERAVIVGLSFGGGVAAWLAAHQQHRVAGLVLVAPAANESALVPVDRMLALPIVGYLASSGMLAAAGLALSVGAVRKRVAARLALRDDYLVSMGLRLRSRRARRAFSVEQRAMLRELPALERRLHGISAPTTVIVGSGDTVVPPAAGRKLAEQIAGARLIEIAAAGHRLFAQHPGRIAEEIVAAAGRRPGRSGADAGRIISSR
jgi:pimeloyl-ACP methyl ester carboxylesterase